MACRVVQTFPLVYTVPFLPRDLNFIFVIYSSRNTGRPQDSRISMGGTFVLKMPILAALWITTGGNLVLFSAGPFVMMRLL